MIITDRPDRGDPEAEPGHCATCSAPLAATVRFCPSCGTAVERQVSATDEDSADLGRTPEQRTASTATDAEADVEAADADPEGDADDIRADADLAAKEAGADVRDDADAAPGAAGARDEVDVRAGSGDAEVADDGEVGGANDDTRVLAAVRAAAGAVRSDADTVAVPVPPATAGGSTICRACSAANAGDRLICGACGVDLDTGETGLAVEPIRPETVVSTGRRGSRGHRWRIALLVVVAALAVVGGVAGGLALLGVGPFAAGEEEVPDVVFESERYPDDPRPLTLTDIATLTTRAPEGERTFTPEHMVDGDPLSSWHQDASALPEATSEKIDLFLEEPSWITAVVFANGDQLEPDAYADAARIQQVELVFDGQARVAATLLDQGLELQIVELSEPLLTTALRVDVVSSIPGLEREDVALSEVELLGYVAEGADVELAGERADIRPAAGAVILPAS